VTIDLLVAGFSTRHIVGSAHNAGHRVIAVDHFCDLDLEAFADACYQFETLQELASIADRVAREEVVDGFLAGSGAETLTLKAPLIGTPPDIASRFLDKAATQSFLEKLGVSVPRLVAPGHYPAMAKPVQGSGGWRNRILASDAEMEHFVCQMSGQPYLLQEMIRGAPASVSCLTDGTEAVAVGTNRQLLRGTGEMGFGFAGSVTPCDHPLADEMATIAEEIVGASGCVGTVGVDFVLPDSPGSTPVAIEVNPRFQGTLDTVEAATGMNLVSLHLAACAGRLPHERPRPRHYAARRIVFADRDLVAGYGLAARGQTVADIPRPGTPIPAGSAVVSVLASGSSSAEALVMLDKHITGVRSYIEQW